MNNTGLINALLTMLATIATALIALFTTEGVTQFSDISQVAYATVVLGGLAAGLATYRAKISYPEEKKIL